MKKLIFIFFLICNIGVAQTIQTKATSYFYFYKDSTKNIKGDCYLDVSISTDTVNISVEPPMILRILQSDPIQGFLDGKLINMWCRDVDGNGCIVKLFISPSQNEMQVVYDNIILSFILE